MSYELINDIKNNTITSLTFVGDDDDAIDNVREIISAIQTPNTSITKVEMTDDFLGCVKHDARSDLLRSLGSLTSLQEVKLCEGLLLIRDIAEILLEAKTLKVLSMTDIVLQGVEEDFHALELALHQHPSIKEFVLDDCRPAVEEIDMTAIERAGRKQSVLHGGGVIDTNVKLATSSSSRAA